MRQTCQRDEKLTFLSTLSLRRATRTGQFVSIPANYFYPRSPCGERLKLLLQLMRVLLFLSTLSLRRATLRVLDGSKSSIISIHALLAESDTVLGIQHKVGEFISIHALLAESDPQNWQKPHGQKKFLSTLSLRRATYQRKHTIHLPQISIHALLAESDAVPPAPQGERSIFLSTLSLRRATNTSIAGRITSNDFYPRSPCGERPLKLAQTSLIENISIHALLAESDRQPSLRTKRRSRYFYPRSPCGERPSMYLYGILYL